MRELVKLAEAREARAKEEISSLLLQRSVMYESSIQAPEGSADLASAKSRIAETQRGMDTIRRKFDKFRSICIAAEQVPGVVMGKGLGWRGG